MLVSLFSVSFVVANEPRSPNVLFILADDLGWADTTLYGHTKLYRTPNIERLASRGLTFTHAYSASPLCSPTRSAILTGLSPARTGVTTPNCHLPQVVLKATARTTAAPDQMATVPEPVTRLLTDYITLAEVLQSAGYATGHFGKWHLGSDPYSPLQQGFESDIPHHSGPGPAGSYVAPWKFPDFDHDPNVPDQHIEDRMASEAVQWMREHRDGPFFLNYWMFSVHAPFDAKRQLIEKYRQLVDPMNPQHCPTYAAMVESMDDAVGTLLNALDELGLSENTIIVFTSDNGGNMYSQVDDTVPTSNAPLRGGKACMYEGGTRVPCVVVWPNHVEAQSRTDIPIQSEDFMPTLLEGLGIEAPNQAQDGCSLLSVWTNQAEAPTGGLAQRPLFQFFPHAPAVPDWLPPCVSVHRGDWKLIRIFHGSPTATEPDREGAGLSNDISIRRPHRYLLYNLKDDLEERYNLADQYPQIVHELDALIEDFLDTTQAVVPLENPKFDAKEYHAELEGVAKLKPSKPPNPSTSSATASKDPGDNPAMQGWKTRGCQATVRDGVAVVMLNSTTPFLGVTAGRLAPGATLKFRIQSSGKSRVDWLPGGTGSAKNPRSTDYHLETNQWQEVSVSIDVKEPENGILRLYLPTETTQTEIDWIELKTGNGSRRWDF